MVLNLPAALQLVHAQTIIAWRISTMLVPPKHVRLPILVAILAGLVALAAVLVRSDSHAGDAIGLMPAPVLGVTVDPTMRVVDVERDSAAARAGVQVGDRLNTLDTIRLMQPRAKVRAKLYVAAAQHGATLTLTLERDGQPLELDVLVTPFTGAPGHLTPTPVMEPHYYF